MDKQSRKCFLAFLSRSKQSKCFLCCRNLTLSLYKKEITGAKKIKDLELVNGDMLELIEDKNKNEGEQLVERLLGLKEVFIFYIGRAKFKL